MPEGSVELTMTLTIDALGKRYGMLPNEVMQRANTFDIFIMDAALTYENHMHEKSMKKYDTAQTFDSKPVTDDSMLTAFKNFKEGKK